MGPKFDRYRSTSSFAEHVLIDPTADWVRIYRRTERGWMMTSVTDPDAAVTFESVGVTVPMSEICRGVQIGDMSTILPDDDPKSGDLVIHCICFTRSSRRGRETQRQSVRDRDRMRFHATSAT